MTRPAGELLLPILLAAPLLVMLQYFGWDIGISRLFFDAGIQRFPHADNWLLKGGLHDGAKTAAILFACLLFAGALVTHFYRPWKKHRRMLWLMLVAMLLSAATVAAIKHFSYPACPHQLQIFGGDQPHVGIFDAIPAGYLPGRCWPGGHGSTAFSLFSLYFAARSANRPRLARGMLAFVLLFGLVLSLAQVMRGMHFLSHQVWTALICWYLTVLLYRLADWLNHAVRSPRQ